MTTRSSKVLVFRVSQEDKSTENVMWLEGDDQHHIVLHTRITPNAEKQRPRWAGPYDVEPPMWRNAIGKATLRTFLGNKMADQGMDTSANMVIQGVWAVDLTEKDNNDLDSDTPRPNSLMTRIQEAIEAEPTVKVWPQPNLAQVTEWLSDTLLPVLATNADLSEFTEPTLGSKPTVEGTLSVTEKDGITLSNGSTYLPVEFRPGLTDVDLLRTARANGKFVLLLGPPGTGKSALVEAAFGDHELIVGNEDTTRADFMGTYMSMPDGTFPWESGALVRSILRDVPLFVDEALLIDPRVLSTLYSLMDGRRVLPVTENPTMGTLEAGPNWYVIFASNPDVPGAVMSEALASRCVLKPKMFTNYSVAERLGVPSTIVKIAANMDTKRRNGEVMWAPQMRDLLAFRDVHATYGMELALANLLENCDSDSDREVIEDEIMRTLGVSNIRPFHIS